MSPRCVLEASKDFLIFLRGQEAVGCMLMPEDYLTGSFVDKNSLNYSESCVEFRDILANKCEIIYPNNKEETDVFDFDEKKCSIDIFDKLLYLLKEIV